jgi:hypothetical protein
MVLPGFGRYQQMMLKDRQAKPYTESGRDTGSRNLWITGAKAESMQNERVNPVEP